MANQEELTKLKKQRTVLKAKFTKFINFIDNEQNQSRHVEIKLRLKKLEGILDEFEQIQCRIDEITNEVSSDFDEFENLYYATISRAHGIVESNNSLTPISIVDSIGSNQAHNSGASYQNNIRLPKIELVTFDGAYDKWLDFYNCFQSIIHNEQSLSGIQKFHYLRSCLKGEAMSVINALESSEENYTIAWDLLKNRFDNKRVIIQNHVKTLMELPSISKESAHELRKLIDTIRTHLRALKSLGEPVDTWDTLLIYTITSKIDRNTHREWERSVSGTEMPKMKTFMDFLEQRCQILQVTSINVNQNNNNNSNKSHGQTNKRHALTAAQKTTSCLVCKGSHKLHGCEIFQKMGVKERTEKVKSINACFNCLNIGHKNDACSWSGCKKCGKKHNTLLHYEGKTEQESKNKEIEGTPGSSAIKTHSAIVSAQILLSTAVINIKAQNGDMVQARVLLDSGSQSHFITKKLADRLKLPLKNVDLPVEGLNRLETRIKHSVSTEIHSKTGDYNEKLDFLVIPRISDYLPNQFIDKSVLDIPHNIKLADPKFYEPNEVDALIGVEVFYNLMCIGQIEIPGHRALLHKTKLGWIISGKIGDEKCPAKPNTCMFTLNSLHKSISKFWEIEEIETKTFLSEEEFQVEEHFKQTTKRDSETGRYIVRLSFNEKIVNLGESFNVAQKQFYSLERKLAKDSILKTQYVESMREAIALTHMVEIRPNEVKKQHCFLPHHPVVKESSSTTKVRVVYNASAKTSTGISLNDCLKVGAVVQNTSFDILLRFRTHQIVMLADIEKMYKQILLDKRDAQYQLILWRENEFEELKTFMIPVVLFGCASAPHSATRVLIQLADDEKSKFPIASEILKRDCYVDDVMTGADSIKDAKKVRDELIEITKSGGFTLRKWVSNNSEVIESMPGNLTHINLLTDNNSQMKALGIQWNSLKDEITYRITEELDSKITKRCILSNIARIYDPIGLIGPVIVFAKILMQKLWQCSSGWDESVPHNIYTAWANVKRQLPRLNEVNFQRKTVIENESRTEIHGFCDASEKAYGACIYVRSMDSNGKIMTNLLCSKNRIAPLKTISLPKLELCAALLLARLIKTVLHAFQKKIDEIYLWSDSSITLQWINTQPYLLKTFVANRVSEIRDITKSMRWRHTPSQDNIADVLSRGQLPDEFVKNHLWITGPEWLKKDQTHWPNDMIRSVPLCELKPMSSFNTAINNNRWLTKYSSISKLKRVMAYVLRFKNNLSKDKTKLFGHLTTRELQNSLNKILKITQNECFQGDLKQLAKSNCVNTNSDLRALSPFLDKDGLIRAGGRLKNSLLSYSEKYPIILPKNHHITQLIIREQHILNLHGGTQATLNAVRSKYWPLNGKRTTKMIVRNCVTCFRVKPRDCSYFMGDLPRNRVIQTRPFLNAGVDYCGPFYIKEKKHRNRGRIKVYACIFVCFATKAIHIELVTDLSTETFIASLRRFFARRGQSLNLYSDNATNFVGAKNELDSLRKLILSEPHNDKVSTFLINKGTNWHFTPPRSPHFGGLWEAAVKSFKHHYYRTVGDKLFTYEELETYTTEIEAILNSRPITPLSEDPNDLRALSPAHFLIGDTFTSLPDPNLMDQPINRLSNWQHIQYVKQHFWKRWHKEYLNQLTTRSKWQLQSVNDIKVGTMVLLKEDNLPPLHWPLGRVVKVFPGDDNKVRVIGVKTHSGVYKRCVTKVAPLPIS